MFEWVFRFFEQLGAGLPKKPKHGYVGGPPRFEYWFKCPHCVFFQFSCTDPQITTMLVDEHNRKFHPEMKGI